MLQIQLVAREADLNPGPPDYKSVPLTTRSHCPPKSVKVAGYSRKISGYKLKISYNGSCPKSFVNFELLVISNYDACHNSQVPVNNASPPTKKGLFEI